MKTLIFALCSLLLAGLCTATIESASATIPLFVWSDKQILSKQNEQILDTLTQEDIQQSLYTLLGLGAKESFIPKVQTAPEVVVLFVEPQLQTDQIPHFGAAYEASHNGGSFSGLKTIIESSTSSLVAPYATAGVSFSLLDSLLGRIARETSVLLVRSEKSALFSELKNVKEVTLEEFKSSNVFSNGKTELVVVCLGKAYDQEDLAKHDDLIASVSKVVSSATSGNFVGMYTGNTAQSSLLWTFPNPNAALFEQPQFGAYEVIPGNSSTNYTGPRTYLTGTMLEVFMVVIALLTMLFVGICNICGLQVPEQYETPKQNKQL